jgi:hypothetical protein
LNRIICKRKLVLINHAHQRYTPPSILGSKMLYPSPTYLNTLANEANCTVIASCHHGMTGKDVIDSSPTLWEKLKMKDRPTQWKRDNSLTSNSLSTDNESHGDKKKQNEESKSEDNQSLILTDDMEASELQEYNDAMASMKKKKSGFFNFFRKKISIDKLGDFPCDDEFEAWEEEKRLQAILDKGIDPEGHLYSRYVTMTNYRI